MNREASCSTPVVRGYAPEDRPAVEAVCRDSPEAAQWAGELLDRPDPALARIWVVEREGRVCGFLVARRILDEAEILNLAVARDSRRMGLGTLLLRAAMAELIGCGARAFHLEVRQSNSAALAFYRGHGFSLHRVRPAYYRDPPEAALCLTRKPGD